jgi:enoyl-CoA hydratase/carnithine racemase
VDARPAAGDPLVDGPPALALTGIAAVITLRRPAEHNRIDPDDLAVLRQHLDAVSRERDVRALVITGTGTATFSSGFTIEAILDRLDRRFEDVLDAIETFPLPTICAMNGSVYGGATDLALCCDFRIGIHGTKMFMPAARFGLHYHPGGLRRFTTQLGPAEAKRLFLTGQTIDAETMLRIGFLTDLVPREGLAARVDDYLAALAKCEPGVVRTMKQQIMAIAGADRHLAATRRFYEDSLRSDELRKRVGAAAKRR